mmetsp:Transcript_44658/g.126046  ORF Transcript_44658/g.126046 Transcript_44658/m.126046 type:complete len:240 (+) Transcript_44658:448-1167(+)
MPNDRSCEVIDVLRQRSLVEVQALQRACSPNAVRSAEEACAGQGLHRGQDHEIGHEELGADKHASERATFPDVGRSLHTIATRLEQLPDRNRQAVGVGMVVGVVDGDIRRRDRGNDVVQVLRLRPAPFDADDDQSPPEPSARCLVSQLSERRLRLRHVTRRVVGQVHRHVVNALNFVQQVPRRSFDNGLLVGQVAWDDDGYGLRHPQLVSTPAPDCAPHGGTTSRRECEQREDLHDRRP